MRVGTKQQWLVPLQPCHGSFHEPPLAKPATQPASCAGQAQSLVRRLMRLAGLSRAPDLPRRSRVNVVHWPACEAALIGSRGVERDEHSSNGLAIPCLPALLSVPGTGWLGFADHFPRHWETFVISPVS